MMVCLKHVGIKMSVKTLASWSAHALSTRPGNPSCGLLNVDLINGLSHIG